MYRRYYSYNDMPQVVKNVPKCEPEKKEQPECRHEHKKECDQEQRNGKLFGKFELDDVILGVIILAILLDDGDDSLLLLALAIVFLTGLI